MNIILKIKNNNKDNKRNYTYIMMISQQKEYNIPISRLKNPS